MSQLRKCSQCGGPVYLSKATFNLQRPHPLDPTQTIPYTVTGLGTWRCSSGCSRRTVLVPRYVGAGKEGERGSVSRGHNFFKGMDIADEAFKQLEVLRPIAALPGTPKRA